MAVRGINSSRSDDTTSTGTWLCFTACNARSCQAGTDCTDSAGQGKGDLKTTPASGRLPAKAATTYPPYDWPTANRAVASACCNSNIASNAAWARSMCRFTVSSRLESAPLSAWLISRMSVPKPRRTSDRAYSCDTADPLPRPWSNNTNGLVPSSPGSINSADNARPRKLNPTRLLITISWPFNHATLALQAREA